MGIDQMGINRVYTVRQLVSRSIYDEVDRNGKPSQCQPRPFYSQSLTQP